MKQMLQVLLMLGCVVSSAVGQPMSEFVSDAHTRGLWHLNEGAGDIAADASGNMLHGELGGNATWTSGRFGDGIHTLPPTTNPPDTGAHVYCGDSMLLRPSVVTCEAWVNADSIRPNDMHIVTSAKGHRGFGLYLSEGGKPSFRVESGRAIYEAVADNAIGAGEWHHLAGTFDGSIAAIWVDGAMQASIPGSLSPSEWPLVIGADVSIPYTSDAFRGVIDEVRISDEVRYVCDNAMPLTGQLEGTIGPGQYCVIGDITVEHGDTLTILPGTTLDFQGAYGIDIDGHLEAVGIETDSILFTCDTVAVPERWSGLDFAVVNASSASGHLEYCTIEFASNQYPGGGVALSDINSTSLMLNHCSIRYNQTDHSGGGVYCSSLSEVTINDCDVYNNSSGYNGGGVSIEAASGLVIEDCVISGNSASHGGGVYLYGGDLVMNNCVVTDNTATMGGGIYTSFANPVISNCVVTGNLASYSGGGIVGDYGGAIIRGCTIAGNSPCGVSPAYPGGVDSLINSIVWGNCPEQICLDGDTQPVILLCCDVDTVGIGYPEHVVLVSGNIFTDPMFCDPVSCMDAPTTEGDYTISRCSPCSDFLQPSCGRIGALGIGCGADPAPVEDLVIIENYPDADLLWSQVTTTTCGAPQNVDAYLVFYSEYSEGPWFYHGYAPASDTTYTHYGVLQSMPTMYYQVEAFVGTIGAALQANNSNLLMRREELYRQLRRSEN